jgi:BASS family bile acid:Na+ symporter
MLPLRKLCLVLAALAFLTLLAGLIAVRTTLWQPAALMLSVTIAVGIGALPVLKGYQFTAWIAAAVGAGLIYPQAFSHWGDFDLRNKWLILLVVQIVMFGMGTQMSLRDFAGVAKTPRGVLVGILCHFSVMPLVGFGLTRLFHFEPEIAAGIILIGSCSSGLASNVMAFIAKSNLVLSVTVTAITTMIAPLMTPLLMKLLAGTMVEIKFFTMMMEIVKIVLVPIGAALLHDYLKTATPYGRRTIFLLSGLSGLWLVALPCGSWTWFSDHFSIETLHWIGAFGFLLSAIVFGVVYHSLTKLTSKLDRLMPVASMAGIVYFTTVTTAAGRDNLLKIGGLLFLAAAIHNAAGYFFGYWLSRGAGLDKNSARSVAFEVGLQNGGMASGLAGSMGKLATVGLAAAIFSPWMNISGSILANYWRRLADREAKGKDSPNTKSAPETSVQACR